MEEKKYQYHPQAWKELISLSAGFGMFIGYAVSDNIEWAFCSMLMFFCYIILRLDRLEQKK